MTPTPAFPARRRRVLAPLAAVPFAGAVRAADGAARPGVRVPPQPPATPGPARARPPRPHLLPPSSAHATGRRYPGLHVHDAQNLFDDATPPAGPRAAAWLFRPGDDAGAPSVKA